MATASCVIVAMLCVVLQSTTGDQGATQKLTDYVNREWPGESHQQAVTSTALTLLADAIETSAARQRAGTRDLAADITRLRRQITEYRTGTPGDLTQSRRLRRLLIDTSSVIEQVLESAGARQRPRDARLNALERSAKALSEDAPVRRQPDVLEYFFRHAVDLLQRLEQPIGSSR